MIIRRTLLCFFHKGFKTFPTHTKSSSVFKYFFSDKLAFGVKKIAGYYNDISDEYWIQVLLFIFIKRN
tara:strand:- start:26646 stop:26849 length:204 start_codon:yes stop_codon:yes gene_type:complete